MLEIVAGISTMRMRGVACAQGFGELGSRVWDGSLVLARWLEKNCSSEFWRGKKCIELGRKILSETFHLDFFRFSCRHWRDGGARVGHWIAGNRRWRGALALRCR
jgi:hypothetical protein